MSRLHSLASLLAGLALAACATAPATRPDGTRPRQSFAACDTKPTFIAPNPKYAWTPNAIKLVSEKVAPGVFVVSDSNARMSGPAGVPLATSGGFVIGEDGVLLVESMINRQLFCQFISLVQQETDKPIRYVVNTSAHGDHSYGNVFLPKDVHVVQHARTAAYIAAHFAEDVAFMKANFGADQGLDEIKPVAADIPVSDSGWSVDLGGMKVEARYHGFAQTEGDLFVWVPSAKVLWLGNPIVAAKPAIPWLLDGHAREVGVTLAAVKAALPADAIVVPGHDRPMGRDVFDFSLGYLDTLQGEVRASVAKGLSQEQTVSAVTMQPYQGYALWGWIHSSVNVPHTYVELKGSAR